MTTAIILFLVLALVLMVCLLLRALSQLRQVKSEYAEYRHHMTYTMRRCMRAGALLYVENSALKQGVRSMLQAMFSGR